jgi:hypothetical protein
MAEKKRRGCAEPDSARQEQHHRQQAKHKPSSHYQSSHKVAIGNDLTIEPDHVSELKNAGKAEALPAQKLSIFTFKVD